MDQIDKIRRSDNAGRLSFLFKDSIIYGGAIAASKLLYLFVIPVLARVFSKDEFGAVDGITVLSVCFGFFITFGQDSAVARLFFETEDKEEKKHIVTNAFLIELLLSIIVSTVLYFNAHYISFTYFKTDLFEHVIEIMALGLPFAIFVQFFQNLLKWTFSRSQFIILSIGSIATILSLTLVFVLVFDMGVAGVFYAKLIGNVLFTIVGLYYCRKHFSGLIYWKYTSQLISFGWPLMLVAVSGALIPALDRYFITKSLTLEAMAIYAMGFRIASLLRLPITGFQTAWGPFAFSIYKEESAQKTYNIVFFYHTVVMVSLGLIIILLIEPITLLIGSEKYLASSNLIVPLVFAFIIESFGLISGIGIGLSKKTYYRAIAYLSSLVITLLFIIVLIEPFGLIGVAYSVLIGKIALTIILSVFGAKTYQIHFDVAPTVKIFILGLVLAITSQFFVGEEIVIQLLIRFACFAIFIMVVWFGLISPLDRQKAIATISKYLNSL